MSYSKLHASVVNSSLWTEEDHVRLLFITLLAMCDKHGEVHGSRIGLERAAMITWNDEEDRNPWEVLLSPDPHSCDKMRAPENEGRRIEEIPGGFRLLNFAYYRGLRNEDDRREQNRIAQAKHKIKVSRDKPSKALVSHGKPQKAHTETETESLESGVPDSCPATLEIPKRGTGDPDPDPVVLTFPTTGPVKEWNLTESMVRDFRDAYPEIDIRAEARVALQWVKSNRKKTARGMTRFLNAWFSRTINNSRGNGKIVKPATHEPLSKKDPFLERCHELTALYPKKSKREISEMVEKEGLK